MSLYNYVFLCVCNYVYRQGNLSLFEHYNQTSEIMKH